MDVILYLEPFKYIVLFMPILCYFLYKKITHPVCIFVGVLSLQYVIYQWFQHEKYSLLTKNTELSIFLGLWGFVLGFAFVSFVILSCRRDLKFKLVIESNLLASKKLDRWFVFSIFLMVLVSAGHLLVGYKNGIDGTYSSFIVNVRMQYIGKPDSFFLLPHVAIFLQSWFVYLIIHRYRVKQVTICFVALSVICALSKLERSAIITALLTLIVIKDHASSKGVRFSSIAFVVLFILSVFFFVAWQFDQSRSLSDISFVFLDYFAKNLDTFNKYISPLPVTYDWGLVLGKYAVLFGLSEPDAIVDIDVDGSFNTYSYLKNLYLFGGSFFVFVFNVLMGAAFSIFYELRYKFDGLVLGFISFFSFSLFVSFFAYSFAWTNWLYYAISFSLIRYFTRSIIS